MPIMGLFYSQNNVKDKRAMIDQSTIIGVTQGSVLHVLKTNNLFPQCESVSDIILYQKLNVKVLFIHNQRVSLADLMLNICILYLACCLPGLHLKFTCNMSRILHHLRFNLYYYPWLESIKAERIV